MTPITGVESSEVKGNKLVKEDTGRDGLAEEVTADVKLTGDGLREAEAGYDPVETVTMEEIAEAEVRTLSVLEADEMTMDELPAAEMLEGAAPPYEGVP